MKIPAGKLSNQNFMWNEADLDNALGRIVAGRTILFTGAGFSAGATNAQGQEPPRARKLASLISELGGFGDQLDPSDLELDYVAERYLESPDRTKLISLLKSCYKIRETTESHNIICGVQWKRMYTTNYDDSIEVSAAKIGKVIDSITLESDPREFSKKENICLHINGLISSLNDNALDSSFKLSDSSYTTPESFTTSPWYLPFKRDLESCTAILFIGYSLYDIEIKKILFGYPAFKEKTFFIIGENPSDREIRSLSKFGNVFPIGIDNFARRLSTALGDREQSTIEFWTEAFQEYSISDLQQRMKDSDIDDFLLHGRIEGCYIDNAISGVQTPPYLIVRDELKKAVEFVRNNKNVVIVGEFGNGKSIFVQELMSSLVINGEKVFYLNDETGKYCEDLYKFSCLESKVTLVVDGYEKYFDLVEYFGSLNPNNVRLVLNARTAEHERLRERLQNTQSKFYEICVDVLSDAEVEQFISIVNNLGYWGDLAHLSDQAKERMIKQDCKSQISLTLLELFNAKQIRDRIAQLTEVLFKTSGHKDTLFTICLLEVLDYNLSNSVISEVSGCYDIYETKLLDDKSFQQLFKLEKAKIKSKSPILALSLLKNHFSPSFVIEKLLDIVENIEKSETKDNTVYSIFKSLLTFSKVERIISNTSKKSSLLNYYEQLKIRVPRLQKDPQFWLQYGMSRIPFSEYDKANKYFAQAYALARGRENYDTSYIDAQQARVFLFMSLQEVDISRSFKHFEDAHALLASLNNNIYKFRQINNAYRNVYDAKYSSYSKGQQSSFEQACKRMKADLDKAERQEDSCIQETVVISLKEQLTAILTAIQLSRPPKQ